MRAAFIFHLITLFRQPTRLLVVLTLGLAINEPALAANNRCNEPIFGVAGVRIDQRAENASKARDMGIRNAAERAFAIVLDRLLPTADGQAQFMAAHDLDDFSDFTHIVEENNLEQRYIATLDFCFDAARLRQAMIAARLQWSELQSPPILVVPVWKGPDGARAWYRDNKWLAGWWDAVASYSGLLSLRQLDRNLINERQFRGEDLADANPVKLAAAASLVKAEQIMVVMAALDYDGSKPVITITARLFDKNGQLLTDNLYGDQMILTNLDQDGLDEMRRKIIAKMDSSWYTANLIDGAVADYLTVFMPVSSVKDWAMRLTALNEVAVVQSYDILSLDTKGGQVVLRLVGSREALGNALSAHKLELVDDNARLLIKAKPENS
ncbi:MAG: hypothetical protein CMQ22_09035 [Gammaproteobacteria bacterium]|nr:hypothetical protein [Gammaproteobacteria bacterium]|tara:strand:+ start:159 stop:1304 length:1146 start_codon:yes stop_codon:yes gene_type:complete